MLLDHWILYAMITCPISFAVFRNHHRCLQLSSLHHFTFVDLLPRQLSTLPRSPFHVFPRRAIFRSYLRYLQSAGFGLIPIIPSCTSSAHVLPNSLGLPLVVVVVDTEPPHQLHLPFPSLHLLCIMTGDAPPWFDVIPLRSFAPRRGKSSISSANSTSVPEAREIAWRTTFEAWTNMDDAVKGCADKLQGIHHSDIMI